jgi:Arc/MetJ-type ribon-helix-helix transcriptional regulator
MNLSLPVDIQQRVDAQLAAGAFATGEEVLRSALESLERRQTSLAKLKTMLDSAEEDVAAGRVGLFDREAIKKDVRARLSDRGITE